MGQLDVKDILAKLTKKFLPDIMPEIMPRLMVRLMADLLAKPEKIESEWLDLLDPEFDLRAFVIKYPDSPFRPEDLDPIIADYEPEDAVCMVYALAAYIKYNRMKADFPSTRRRGRQKQPKKPGPKTHRRKAPKGGKTGRPASAPDDDKDDSLDPRGVKRRRFAAAFRAKYPVRAAENLFQALVRSFNRYSTQSAWIEAMIKAGIPSKDINGSEFYAWRADPKIKKSLVSKAGLDD